MFDALDVCVKNFTTKFLEIKKDDDMNKMIKRKWAYTFFKAIKSLPYAI